MRCGGSAAACGGDSQSVRECGRACSLQSDHAQPLRSYPSASSSSDYPHPRLRTDREGQSHLVFVSGILQVIR